MKWIHCLIIVLFLQLNIFSQEGWYQQTSGTSQDLYSVYFVNKDTGWTVGDNGVLLKTTNGGSNWIFQSTNLSTIQSIYFIDDYTGFIVGSSSSWGKLLKTTDGGNTWNEKQTLMEAFDFPSDIFFIDRNIGWLILCSDEMSSGPYMQKTIDGGKTWFELQSCPPSGNGNSFKSIFFTDNNNGWLGTVGSLVGGYLYKTTDGGDSWTENLDIYFLERFYDLFFLDNDLGWTVCHSYDSTTQNQFNLIYKTTNAGNDWNIQFCDTTYLELRSIQFIDANYGWACGDDGIILYTSNGGNDWLEQLSGTTNRLRSLYFVDHNTGWVVGDGGTILKTATGGITYIEEQEIDEILIDYCLSQNYPNPFNPSTKIKYTVPKLSNVIVKVFDILGSEVETIVNAEKPAGNYELSWFAENLPSGVYLYQINIGDFVETKKMLLMK